LSLKRLCLVDGEGLLRTAKDKFLNVAFDAIPRVSEIIAAYPVEHRAGAFKVAAQRYRRAAQDFGCNKEDCEGSVDTLLRTLRVQVKQQAIVQGKLTSLLRRLAKPASE
jgi:hypothetical protein